MQSTVIQRINYIKWKTFELLINYFVFILPSRKSFLALHPHLLAK